MMYKPFQLILTSQEIQPTPGAANMHTRLKEIPNKNVTARLH